MHVHFRYLSRMDSLYYRLRVSNFNLSESRKQCFLASDWLKFETLPRKYPTLQETIIFHLFDCMSFRKETKYTWQFNDNWNQWTKLEDQTVMIVYAVGMCHFNV